LLANKENLPTATAGKTYSGKFVVRVGPDLHKKAAVKALARGESLNQFVAEAIANAWVSSPANSDISRRAIEARPMRRA
jgi:predicted HicB family RNase H-like nuclease